MASVSQVIPNYVQGISNQPDQLKIPGQVRDLKNAWPDVTRGCLKRPGSKHIADLHTYSDGTWFTIDRGRNPTQQFLGKVWHSEARAPQIQVWDLNGKERKVIYSDTPYDDPDIKSRVSGVPWNNNDYLKAKKNKGWKDNTERKGTYKFFPLKVCQGDGKTFLLNDQVVPKYNIASMKELNEHRDKNGKYNYFESFVSLRQVQYQRDYMLAFDDPDKFDNEDNVTWDYATSIGDVSWPNGDPNGTYFDGNKGQDANDPALAYTRYTINADDITPIGDLGLETPKIVLLASSNPNGEALEISLEVYAQPVQLQEGEGEDLYYYYEAEVTPRVQLLKGGKNWKAGDYVTIAYRPDSELDSNWDEYTINDKYFPLKLTIGENSNVTIMADIGYISVKTTNDEDADATIPFASASDIIQGLCYGLEQAGAKALKFDDDGNEVVNDGEDLYSEPGTVKVTFGGSGDENVSEAPVTREEPDPDPDPDTEEPDEGPPNTGGAFLEGLNIEFKPIGNGIYMRKIPVQGEEGKPFKLVTPEDQLFNHMSTKEKGEWYCTVHAVSRLPNQCRHDLKVKVMNTENNNEDDYYITFVGHDNVDGEGSWEECAKPGYRAGIDWNTMPYELIYVPEIDSFVVTPIKWQLREVGDENTAPAPSFLPTNLYRDQREGQHSAVITGMGWYRNRFLLFSDKHICASADGDYYNFWPKTARTVTDTDPIDITAAAQMPSAITQCMEMTAGLVLFGKEEQFLLTTDADGMRPGTAKVMAISRFNFSENVTPVKMGQNIAFLSNAGLNDKLFEMSQVAREGSEPQVIELSKLVEPRLMDNIDLLTASKSNMSLFMTKYWGPDYLNSETNKDYALWNKEKFREVWGYRWYDNGQRRVQSAWYRWVFDWPVCYHVCLDDNYYAVLYDNYGKCMLRKIGLKHEDEIRDVYLDGYYTGCPQGGCLSSDGTYTVLPIYEGTYRPGDCLYVEMYNKDELLESYRCEGPFEPCKKDFATLQSYPEDHPTHPCETYLTLEGDWTTDCDGNPIDCADPKNPWRITIGKRFDMVVDFPTVYVGKKEGEAYNAKWDPNLTLHRCKFSVGKQAQYNIEIRRKSRDTINQWYDVDFDYPYLTEETFTQPVYMRNIDIDMRLICSDPRGGILYSQQWEGDYNPKWYKYV